MHEPEARSAIPDRVASRTLLDRCLVEGDSAAISSGRRRRNKALGLSLALETAAVFVLVIAPLISGVARPNIFFNRAPVQFIFGAGHRPETKLLPSMPTTKPAGLHDALIHLAPGHPARPARQSPEEIQDPFFSGVELKRASKDFYSSGFSGLRLIEPAPPPEANKGPETKHPVKVNAGVEEAKLILRVEPRYPPLAVMTRTEGTVILHAFISREGRITALDVVSGPPLLVRAALDAVQQWRYRPTLLDGEPVKVETTITVVFRLQR
ncbi:MAG: energy transducer TonB [Candidatus Acidiferrales bacterium]